MGKFGGISGRDAIRRFEKIGYRVVRQRGSHVRLHHLDASHRPPLTIPLQKELKIGLLQQLIKDAGLSVNDFFVL